jgi:hypothetical protein
MKKLYSALLALLLLASFPALAQKGLYFGIAGTAQSTLITNQNNYGLPEMDYKTTFGGAANLNVGFDFTNHLGIKIEVGYGRYGQKYTDKRDSSTFDRDIKLNYLTIPIMLKCRIGGPLVKFYIAIGPQFNMLLSAKQTYNKNDLPYMDDIDDITHNTFKIGKEDIKERFSSSDIYARIDLGIDIIIIRHLMIEAGIKFGYGLMDINAADYRIKDHSGAYHPSHNVFGGITLGLNYHL